MYSTTLPHIAMRQSGLNSFESETQAVLSELRNALAVIIGQLRPEVHRGADLKRLLNLDAKLAWSVFTSASADDLHTLVTVLPGTRAMSRFFDAVALQDVATENIARAKEAFQRFEHTVRTHAADRDVFDAMVSSLSGGNDDIIDEKLRKRMFTDHSIFWGMRSKVSSLTLIERPAAQPGLIDSAILLECLQMQQLRERHHLNLMTETAFGDAAAPDNLRAKLTTHTPSNELSPLVLLDEFCSGPMPKLTAEGAGLSGNRTAIRFSGLGRASAVDLVMAQTSFGAPAVQDSNSSAFAVLTCPSEVSYCDLLVPAGTTDPHSARSHVYANRLNAAKVYERNPDDQVPMKASAVYCGRIRFPLDQPRENKLARSMLAIPESPRHASALNRVVEQLGWNDIEYDAYRCMMKYPVMQTLVELVVSPARAAH